MPSWTIDQKSAIETRGGKIIVSAAAGSGKTAVLSQRVINYCINGGNIDELLIVTFTNAAAHEMKVRIKNKISDAYYANPTNDHLKRQLELVEIAKITTMDAFYGDLVKENFDKLKIDRNFKILSNEEEKILKDMVLSDVFENAFNSLENFDDALVMFGAKDLSLIKDTVLKVASFLDTTPFPDKFVCDALENYSNEDFYKDELLKQIRYKMNSFLQIYDEIIDDLYDDDTFSKVMENACKEKNFINNFLLVKNLDDLSSLIKSITFDTLRTPKGYKDDPVMIKYKTVRDDLKKTIKKDYLELSFINDDVYSKELLMSKKCLKVLFNITNSFKEKLLLEKKKINAYSFSDIAHFVIELLVENGKKTKLAREISDLYNEILIDEYQDTNNLQNVIFNAISKDDTNLFIVGDVKQSIYRFRSACPEIFNNDKKNASKENFPKLITLSKNFRSRKEVLDFCNFVFSNTMTDKFGEINYDKNEMLYLGASFLDGKDLSTEVLIIDGKEPKEELEDELSNASKEAILVANRINELLNSEYKVYDNKLGKLRNIKPSDIVILLRSLKNSDLYIKALNERKISAYSEVSHEYFDNYEIKLVISILKVIDNPYDDVALISLLNSDLVDVSLDEIAKLRSDNKNTSLFETISNSDDSNINNILRVISDLRSKSTYVSVGELLNEIYKTFDIIPIISGLKGGVVRSKNLVFMLNYAVSFESKSLHEFITYLENIMLNKGSLDGINPLSEGDNVLITTIHKSKGLEYPVVFLSETGKNFNFSDLRSDFFINDDLKVAFNLRDNEYKVKYLSLPMMVFRNYEISKMLSEELRILYVALTRAKEKIIISGFTRDLESLINKASSKMGNKSTVSNLYLSGAKCYLDIIMTCILRHPSSKNLRSYSMVNVKVFDDDSILNTKVLNASTINEAELLKTKPIKKENFNESELNMVTSFNYDDSLTRLPVSLSVSNIKAKNSFLRKPSFLTDGVNHTNVGTLYHKVLECLPIKKYYISNLKEELKLLVSKGIISANDEKILDMEKLFAYLSSDIYDMILSSSNVKREFKITFKTPGSYYDDDLRGEILTDGVIDLLFKHNDTYIIVDYKTDNVKDIFDLKERYKIQLDLYEIAIKEILKAKKVRKFIYSIKFNKFIEV